MIFANVSRKHRPHNAGAYVFCVTHPQNKGMSRNEAVKMVLPRALMRDTLAKAKSFSALVAHLHVADAAGIGKVTDIRPYSNDSADRLDRQHEAGIGQFYAAGVLLPEKAEQPGLLGYVPAAVAGTETVGAVQTFSVKFRLQHLFHTVGHRLNDLAPYAVHYVCLEHTVTALHGIGPLEIAGPDGCHEYDETLCAAQLAANYTSRAKSDTAQGESVFCQLPFNLNVLELGTQEKCCLLKQILRGADGLGIGL